MNSGSMIDGAMISGGSLMMNGGGGSGVRGCENVDVTYTEQIGACRRISDKGFNENLQNLLAAVYYVDECKIACTNDETCVAYGWSDTEGCRQYQSDPISAYSGDAQITGFKCYIKNTCASGNGGTMIDGTQMGGCGEMDIILPDGSCSTCGRFRKPNFDRT